MAKKRSAGILPFRPRREGPELFLVHPGGPFWKNKDEGAWSIAKGETIDQAVTLSVSGAVDEIDAVDNVLRLTIGRQIIDSALLPLGLGLDPKDLDATEQSLAVLREAAPSHLVCYYDPRLGHRASDLQRMAAIDNHAGNATVATND